MNISDRGSSNARTVVGWLGWWRCRDAIDMGALRCVRVSACDHLSAAAIAASFILTIVFALVCPGAAVAACAFESPANVIVSETPRTWELLDDKDGVCTWSRSSEASPIQEVAAAAVINARPVDIADLLADCARYPDVFRYVEACEVVREHDEVTWVFQQLNFPWPAEDRYYTIDLRSEALADGVIEVSWTLVNPADADRIGRGIATVRNDGRWHLRPAAGGQHTRALYYLCTDPGGQIPKWLVNLGNRNALPDVIRDVRNELD